MSQQAEANGATLQANSRAELDAELLRLNQMVDSAVAARKTWMDNHMSDYTKYPIGTELFDLTTGRSLGTVTRLYRYWGGRDWRYDSSMHIDYELSSGDNTSRQTGLCCGTREQYAQLLEDRLRLMRR